jgi:hypothetical protein
MHIEFSLKYAMRKDEEAEASVAFVPMLEMA